MSMVIDPYRFVVAAGIDIGDLADLIGWWDLSDSGSVSLSGSDITSVADLSGRAKTLTASGTPTYETAVQNGRNVARMGSSERLTNSSFGNYSNPLFVVAVLRITTASTGYLSWCFGNSNTGENARLDLFTADGVFKTFSNSDEFSASAATNGNAYIVATAIDGASSKCRVNGVETADTLTTGVLLGNYISFGRPDSFAWQGDYCEMGVCSSIPSSGDISSLEAGLASKWGITL